MTDFYAVEAQIKWMKDKIYISFDGGKTFEPILERIKENETNIDNKE